VKAIDKQNPSLLPALRDENKREKLMMLPIPYYAHGSKEEAALIIRNLWPVWSAMPGVEEMLTMVG